MERGGSRESPKPAETRIGVSVNDPARALWCKGWPRPHSGCLGISGSALSDAQGSGGAGDGTNVNPKLGSSLISFDGRVILCCGAIPHSIFHALVIRDLFLQFDDE